MGQKCEQQWPEYEAHGGTSTHVMVLEVSVMIKTDYGLSVRKSRIHLQSEVLGHHRKRPDQLHNCLVWELQHFRLQFISQMLGDDCIETELYKQYSDACILVVKVC